VVLFNIFVKLFNIFVQLFVYWFYSCYMTHRWWILYSGFRAS